MPNAIQSYVVPVQDIDASKATYKVLMGIDPHVESPYYVGFNVNGLEIGLTPAGGTPDAPDSPVAYWHVDDIETMIDDLVAAGASVVQAPQEVAAGVTVARLADSGGNPIGLIHDDAA